MSVPMVIGPKEIADLKGLAAYALANPRSIDDLLDQLNGENLGPGLRPEFTRIIPFGYKVVFTIEQNNMGQYIRRMSISSPTSGRAPTPAAVMGVMKILGFQNELEDCRVMIEDLKDGQVAIQVAELLEMRIA